MAKKKSVGAGRSERPKVTFATLPAYCRKHGFEFSEFDGDEHDPPTIRLAFPTDKQPFVRFLRICDDEEIAELLAAKFERYNVVANYVSIVDMKQGMIEARVTSNSLSGDARVGVEFNDTLPVTFEHDEVRVSIQEASATLRAIHREYHRNKQYSVKITAHTIRSHDEAHRRLVEITDALFFSLEVNDHISLSLVRKQSFATQGFHRQFERIFERQNRKGLKTVFPMQRYDPVPMNLYRYGIHASGFPLLRYLAFYQVLEYYFPVCADDEATQKQRPPNGLMTNLKSKARIASKPNVNPRKRPNEREMFGATLRQCIDPNDLYLFLTKDKEQVGWFSRPISNVTKQCLKLKKLNAVSLLNEVLERVYNIRCSIVHTKSNCKSGFLRPFSEHENELYYDTELVRYLATNVLKSKSEDTRN